MGITPIIGRPGVSASRTASYRNVKKACDWAKYHPGGGIIDGQSRDSGNTDNPFLLRPGLLMGRVTSSKKYRPSILGVSANAYTSGGTSVTVSAAQAAEIVRRVGAAGNLYYVGPPAAAGTVAVLGPIAYSAINTGTGVITTATLGANLIAGGYVVAGDGSHLPCTVIDDGYGLQVPADSSDADFPHILTGGELVTAQIINVPTDSSLLQWVKDQLCKNGGGLFTFDDAFNSY